MLLVAIWLWLVSLRQQLSDCILFQHYTAVLDSGVQLKSWAVLHFINKGECTIHEDKTTLKCLWNIGQCICFPVRSLLLTYDTHYSCFISTSHNTSLPVAYIFSYGVICLFTFNAWHELELLKSSDKCDLSFFNCEVLSLYLSCVHQPTMLQCIFFFFFLNTVTSSL